MKRKSCSSESSVVAPLLFVSKLAAHLCDTGSSNSWTEDGTAFMVVDVHALVAAVCVSEFVKVESVKRQLNLHGFTNVTSQFLKARKQVHDSPLYFLHEHFHRDRPDEWRLVRKHNAKTEQKENSSPIVSCSATDSDDAPKDFLLDFNDFFTDLCDPIELEYICF